MDFSRCGSCIACSRCVALQARGTKAWARVYSARAQRELLVPLSRYSVCVGFWDSSCALKGGPRATARRHWRQQLIRATREWVQQRGLSDLADAGCTAAQAQARRLASTGRCGDLVSSTGVEAACTKARREQASSEACGSRREDVCTERVRAIAARVSVPSSGPVLARALRPCTADSTRASRTAYSPPPAYGTAGSAAIE